MGKENTAYHKTVVDKFCEARGGGWNFVRHNPPPAPDCTITNGEKSAGLELGRYRAQGPLNERVDQDWKLKDRILNEWPTEAPLSEVSVFLNYREDAKQRALIPQSGQWAAFIGELKRIAAEFHVEALDSDFEVVFESRVQHARILRAGVRPGIVLPEHSAPLLAAACRSVILRRSPDIGPLYPRSWLGTFWGWADLDAVGRLVSQKVEKSKGYAVAKGEELWLLLHSDGTPQTGVLPSGELLEQALERARTVLVTGGVGKLDQVWWINDVGARKPNIHKLYPT